MGSGVAAFRSVADPFLTGIRVGLTGTTYLMIAVLFVAGPEEGLLLIVYTALFGLVVSTVGSICGVIARGGR
jgi:hypothetical protein